MPPTHTAIIRKLNIEEGYLSIQLILSQVKGSKAWNSKKVVGSHKEALSGLRVWKMKDQMITKSLKNIRKIINLTSMKIYQEY